MSQAPYGPLHGQSVTPTPGNVAVQPLSQSDAQLWSVFSHLSVFVFSVLGPLVIYLIFKDRSALVRHHASEALNLQLNLVAWAFIGTLLLYVLVGIPILAVALVSSFVMPIVGALAAGKGTFHRHFGILRLVY